jgi:hypothetical protein
LTEPYCSRCDSEYCRCGNGTDLGFLSIGTVTEIGARPDAESGGAPDDRDTRTTPGPVTRLASRVHPEPVSYVWEGRIPKRSVSLVVGPPGLSKTMMLIELMARLSRGQLDGDHRGSPQSSVILSAEDSAAHTLVPRLIAAGADLERVVLLTMSRDGFEGDLRLPDDIDHLEDVIVRHGSAFVVVDPLSAHLANSVDGHRDQDVRLALGPLARVADRTGAGVAAVVHLNKAPSTDLFLKVSGSIGITAAARSILVVARDPEDEDGEQGYKRVLVHGKFNLGPYAPSLRFEVEPRTIHSAGQTISTAGIVWRGIAEGIGPSDVLGTPREPLKRDQAERLLLELLGNGPRPAAEVYAKAEDAGVSEMTLKRAKKNLGIESFREGEAGEVGGGSWYWRLKGVTIKAVTPTHTHLTPLISAGQSRDSEADEVKGITSSELGHKPSDHDRALSVEEIAETFNATEVAHIGDWRARADS